MIEKQKNNTISSFIDPRVKSTNNSGFVTIVRRKNDSAIVFEHVENNKFQIDIIEASKDKQILKIDTKLADIKSNEQHDFLKSLRIFMQNSVFCTFEAEIKKVNELLSDVRDKKTFIANTWALVKNKWTMLFMQAIYGADLVSSMLPDWFAVEQKQDLQESVLASGINIFSLFFKKTKYPGTLKDSYYYANEMIILEIKTDKQLYLITEYLTQSFFDKKTEKKIYKFAFPIAWENNPVKEDIENINFLLKEGTPKKNIYKISSEEGKKLLKQWDKQIMIKNKNNEKYVQQETKTSKQ